MISLDDFKYGFWITRDNKVWRKFTTEYDLENDSIIFFKIPYDYEDVLMREYNASVIEVRESLYATDEDSRPSTQWFLKFKNEEDCMLFMLRWA